MNSELAKTECEYRGRSGNPFNPLKIFSEGADVGMERTPNDALADVIAESGATYYALAREIRSVADETGQRLSTGPSAVAYWVAGGTPSGRTPPYLAEALRRRTKRRVTVAEIGLGCKVGGALRADLRLSPHHFRSNEDTPNWDKAQALRALLSAPA
ncbi:hypothetical protein [Streptomyces sp. DSM 40907]|uniref:hypothetical protein n=1 Tax=Streptomyces kutzneri TaxID=3051179 RepID=UPI0028D536B7|nr:hypothetical protein [Streptomyces sp. DSM 40907]